MARHLLVNTNEHQELIDIIDTFLLKVNPNNMIDFLRYNQEGNLIHPCDFQETTLVFQNLTDRYEDDDRLVLCVSPYNFKFPDGDICKNAIAEVHIKNKGTMQIYCVL